MNFKIDGTRILDENNRQRIFKGVNYCLKYRENSVEAHHLFKRADKEIDELIELYLSNGVNIVRLGFTWAMLEPNENEFDEKALSFLKLFVERCKDNNIYVVLDCHQDLFYCNSGIGDGAPKWIAGEYKEKHHIAIWAEGYFYMQDVQRAFNDFWRNKNDMQTRFVSFWKRVANEFKDYDNIIGFDYFNEPMINDNSNKVFCSLVNNALKQGSNIDFDAERYYKNGAERLGFTRMFLAIATRVKTISNLKKMLNNLDNYEAFGNVVKDAEEYVCSFNKEYYQPFFNNMASCCNDNQCFNIFEHSYYSNLGIPFSIDFAPDSIYSPHAYDIFIDSPLYNEYSSNNRIKYIIDNIRNNQLKMNVPVIMGEWGGSAGGGNEWIKHIDYVYSLIEENQWSSIYWGYVFKNKKFTQTMNRPYPVAVCGEIVKYHTDSKKRIFELEYNNTGDNNGAKTEIYVPKKGIVEFDAKEGINTIKLNY